MQRGCRGGAEADGLLGQRGCPGRTLSSDLEISEECAPSSLAPSTRAHRIFFCTPRSRSRSVSSPMTASLSESDSLDSRLIMRRFFSMLCWCSLSRVSLRQESSCSISASELVERRKPSSLMTLTASTHSCRVAAGPFLRSADMRPADASCTSTSSLHSPLLAATWGAAVLPLSRLLERGGCTPSSSAWSPTRHCGRDSSSHGLSSLLSLRLQSSSRSVKR